MSEKQIVLDLINSIAKISRRVRRLETREFGGSGGVLDDHDHSGDIGDGGTFDASNLTSGAATDGHVLTADGSGGADWEAVPTAQEGPGIDIPAGTNTIGLGGDTILLYHSDGSPVSEYAATDAGLTAALVAAVSGDKVRLEYAGTITGGPWTIGSGVLLEGHPSASLTGNVTNNGKMTEVYVTGSVTNAGQMRYCYITHSTGTGITQSAEDAEIRYCEVASNGGDYGINLTGGSLAYTWARVNENNGAAVGLLVNYTNAIVNCCRAAGVMGAQIENAFIVDSCHFRGAAGDGLYHTTGTAKIANSMFVSESVGVDLHITGAGLELTNCRYDTDTGISYLDYGSGDRLSTKGIHSVIDYGAAGDGTTNDTAAVQAALTAAAVAGGIVWFPPGTYMCNTLTTYKNVMMVGANWRASIIQSRAAETLVTYSNNATGNAWGGGFKDLAFFGNDTGTIGLYLSGAYTFIIDQCRIHNFKTAGVQLRGSLIGRIYKSELERNAIGIDADYAVLGGTFGTVMANLFKILDCRFHWNTSYAIKCTRGAMLILDGLDLEYNGTSGNAATGCVYFKSSAENQPLGLVLNQCWFESNVGGTQVKIDTPTDSNLYHVIENSIFQLNTGTTYGVYVEGTAVNKLVCRGVEFATDAVTADFYADGANATLYLDTCSGTTGGTGTIITGAPHAAVTVSDTDTIDLTLSTQQISADLKNTTVTPGSYTSADITVDAQGRITAASNGTTTGGQYKQLLWEVSGGTFTFLMDAGGNPLEGLLDLE